MRLWIKVVSEPAKLLSLAHTYFIEVDINTTITQTISDPDKFYDPAIVTRVYFVGRVFFNFDVRQQVAVDDVAEIAASGRPAFIIHGSDDRYTSVEQAGRFAAVLAGTPNGEFWQIDGVEHVKGYATYPDEYLSRLLDFLHRSIGASD